MAELSVFRGDLIKQIGLGINISKTYPKGHPSLIPVVQRLKILLKEIPIEQESVSMVVVEDVIMIENERFDSKALPIVGSLVTKFNQLGVKSITFNVDLSDSDIKEFFAAMASTRVDLADYGDIVALMRSKGVTGIKVNRFRVGVISSDQDVQAVNWEQFLESLTDAQTTMTDEERIKELSKFLAGVGIAGDEPVQAQTGKIIGGLEKLAVLIADQYGEDRWDEYSMVFSRMLGALSPTIKKNVIRYRTENKKLAALFKNLVPTMSDEDIIDVVSMKAKERSPEMENEIVDILKNVTGTRLPGILSALRVNVPELNFEKVASRLMSEIKVTKGEKVADKFHSKNMEMQMRALFPRLRNPSPEERMKALEELIIFSNRVFDAGDYDLVRLLVDRLDTMTDTETEMRIFMSVVDALKTFYMRLRKIQKDDVAQFVSKKFSRHLLRKDAPFLERKKFIIRTISDTMDESYVPELVSLLWDPGTFTEAREALIALSEFSAPVLLEALKDTEDRAVRMKIIDILVRIGAKGVPAVEKLLTSPEWYVRRNGVFILGEMKVSSAVDKIGGLVNDAEEQVQLAVVESLVKIGGEKTTQYIRQALDSEYKRVIIAAVRNLGHDDVVHKYHDIRQWLKSRKGIPEDREEEFRRDLIDAVGKLRDDAFVDALVDILQEKALFKGKVLEQTKIAALYALAQIGSSKALHALREATTYKDQTIALTAKDILEKSGRNP